MQEQIIAERAHSLFASHRAGQPFAPFDGAAALPSLDAAYAVQRRYVALLTDAGQTTVAGYKIGLTSLRMQAMCGIDSPIAGAILATRIDTSGITLRRASYGRLGVEFEIGVRLDRDLPAAGAPYDFTTVAAAVAAVAPAIEVVDDRAANYQGLDMRSLIADNAWNAGLVLGPWCTRWPDLAAIAAVVTRDGIEVDRGHGRDVLGHPFNALTWLVNHLAVHGDGLRRGDIIATGSIVPTRFPAAPEAYVYALDGLGEVTLTIVD